SRDWQRPPIIPPARDTGKYRLFGAWASRPGCSPIPLRPGSRQPDDQPPDVKPSNHQPAGPEPSDIKPEQHHVAVLDDVIPPLRTHQPLGACGGEGTGFQELVPWNDFRPDETPLHIAVDPARRLGSGGPRRND